MKKLFTLLLCLYCIGLINAQTTLVSWNFDASALTATGGLAANSSRSVTTNSTGTLAYASTASGTCASPSGKYVTNTGWDSGNGTKYWRLSFSSTNAQTITFNFDSRASNTGPLNFKVQYNTTSATGTYIDLASASYTNAATCVARTYTLPAACDNQANVFIQLLMTSNTSVNAGTVAGTGTSSLDNIIITAATVLPISLVEFSIVNKNLLFSTATESQNAHFDIERSQNGKDFVSIGRVEGAGNSTTTKKYEFEDKSQAQGFNYYRLKQVDFDGRFEYSKIISTYNGKKNLDANIITAQSEQIKLNIQSTDNQKSIISIIDMSGRLIANYTVFLSKNENDITLDTNLQNGMYAVRISTNSGEQVSKLLSIK